jgi:hypothetical protein
LAGETLLCLDQVIWEAALAGERKAFLTLLAAERLRQACRPRLTKKPCAKSARCFQAALQLGVGLILSCMPARRLRALWPNTFTACGTTSPCGPVLSVCLHLGSGVAWSCSLVGSLRIAAIACFRAARKGGSESRFGVSVAVSVEVEKPGHFMSVCVTTWRLQLPQSTRKLLILHFFCFGLSRRRSRVRAPSSPPISSIASKLSMLSTAGGFSPELQ